MFPSTGSKLGGIYRSREEDSPDSSLSNSCQNSSIDKFFAQKYLTFSNKQKIDSHVGDMTF